MGTSKSNMIFRKKEINTCVLKAWHGFFANERVARRTGIMAISTFISLSLANDIKLNVLHLFCITNEAQGFGYVYTSVSITMTY